MNEEENVQAPEKSTTNTDVAKYDLDSLVSSGAFSFTQRNILKVALSNDKKYSVDEAKKAINNFRGGAN